ncbi:hypothetical protein [Biformimicrobium ophioploci]|uniref:Uncharacterized protein n=1 Tax=Biformimicrobium ophioploci TaxID=3036711 RepID=A0ABQ6LUJ6_9GAMM|nr:hypothetical protein [Microbulbifer sp. NKW57]GMG85758.1 hypothetical protein MNKW57_00790 [Microbulbifer sp. NKW57]
MRKCGILLFALVAGLLVACGGPKEDPKDKPPAPQTEETEKESSDGTVDALKSAGEPSSSGGDTATGISEVPKVKPAYPEERSSTPETPEATQMPEQSPEKQKPGEPPSGNKDGSESDEKDSEPGKQ